MTVDQALQYGTLVGVFVVAIMGQIAAYRAKRQAEEAQRQRDEMKKTVDVVDSRTNHLMEMSLQVGAGALRRLADINKTPEDEAVAKVAERALAEHKENKAVEEAKFKANPGLAPTKG